MSFERSNIEKMQGYTPGEQSSAGKIIKLNTNENPYPPSPQVAASLQAIDVAELRRYPSPLADSFRRAAAKLHSVAPANIVPTNGGDELLRLVFTTFAAPGETIAITQPSYSLYPVLAEVQDCELLEIPLLPDWSMPDDFAAQLQAADARLAILVNPHAPTGMLLSSETLAQLAQNFSGVLVVDEAYVDFVEPALNYDSIPLINRHDNILILRTLSKGYSLAGLRFGYGIADQSLIDPMLYKTRDSYNTDTISQQLATAAIESVDDARQNCGQVRQSRAAMSEALNSLGFETLPSQSNFLLCQVPPSITAENLYQALKQRNILVRYFDQDRLRDKLRISIGNEEENSALLAALNELVPH